MTLSASTPLLVAPRESINESLRMAETALDMHRRGLSYAHEARSKTHHWGLRPMWFHQIICEPERGQKTSITTVSQNDGYAMPGLLETAIDHCRNATSVSDPAALFSTLMGFSRMLALHLKRDEVSLILPYIDPADPSEKRNFQAYTPENKTPIPHDRYPEKLLEYLSDIKLPNFLAVRRRNMNYLTEVLVYPLSGHAKQGDPVNAMLEIALAEAALERGPANLVLS